MRNREASGEHNVLAAMTTRARDPGISWAAPRAFFAAGREISLVQVPREIVRRHEMMNDYYSARSTANIWPCAATPFSFPFKGSERRSE
jgi:hypothetical protein